MAEVEIVIRRDNGTSVRASGDVDDAYIIEIATMLGAMLFESAATSTMSAEEQL